ncbi:redoxin domain-containing protein [Mesomycoplasma lagogenitalium]|uniref:Redoxin domain-containing protein n=1 Tax=Mesomycoplasma lagogenitalium TaxID=171286 RepID=A0ABY8LVW4_9BACT|nr:redoxin domain-containing protein [Mesomycoplasma lagogenitalium]WGI36371.1 redoxin domain-containing protein [Mesomycoplasma lagogenitalium]
MKTKFKGIEYSLVNELISKNEKISLSLTDIHFEDVQLNKFEKLTVISAFPSINTSVCDLQTKGIAKLANEFPNVRFISISMDLPSAISQWKSANDLENMEIYSDYRTRDFGLKSGFLIDKIFLLNRGFLIIDKDSKVLEVSANNDVHEQIDFAKLKSLIIKNLG